SLVFAVHYRRSSKELVDLNASLAGSNAKLDESNKNLEGSNLALTQKRERGDKANKKLRLLASMFNSAQLSKVRPEPSISDQTLAAASVRLWKDILDDDPKDALASNELANALYYQGVQFRKSGNSKEQRRCWLESVAVSEALVRDKPDVMDYAANLAITYYNLGVLASITQKADEKFAWLQKAIENLQPWR